MLTSTGLIVTLFAGSACGPGFTTYKGPSTVSVQDMITPGQTLTVDLAQRAQISGSVLCVPASAK